MKKPTRSLPLFVIAIGLATLVTGSVLWTRGRFTEIVVGFARPSSPVTSLALSPYLPLVLVVLMFATVLIEFLSGNQKLNDICNAVTIAVSVLCFIIYFIGVSAFLEPLLNDLA